MTTPRTIEARSKAAKQVAHAIHEVEASFNQTIANIGRLFTSIAEARLDACARMPLSVGMAASEQAAAMASTAVLGYRQTVQAHDELSADKGRLGLATVSWGDIYNTVTSEDRHRLAGTASLVGDDDLGRLRVVA
jgi:hypothetical protein